MVVTSDYIFVHVPKTAGSSITAVLGGKNKDLATHTPLFQIEKGDRFAFGCVRNPWARMVSLYRFLCQKTFRNTDNFDQAEVRSVGFKKWLMDEEFYMQEDYQVVGEPWVSKKKWKEDGGKLGFPPMQRRPQHFWLDGCDYVAKVERFPTSFQTACTLAGIRNPPSLLHMNQTSGGDWRDQYDRESFDFVAEHFKDDIVRYGY